jgi:alkylated DNA repair dioxygenase AlkB
MTERDIELRDGGQLRVLEGWLSPAEQAGLFERLHTETPWKHESINLFGRSILQPRLTAWYGDPGASYTYSGLTNSPLPWTEALTVLRRRVEEVAQATFNSVLLNYYRDGNDAMGMHSDDEPELGKDPLIASLSLGAMRRFVVQRRGDKSDKRELELHGGSLLIMSGTVQHHYKHGVRKERDAGARINLTFRWVLAAGGRSIR